MIPYTVASRLGLKHGLSSAKVLAICSDLHAERGSKVGLLDQLVEEIGAYGYHAGETKELAPSTKMATLLAQLRAALDLP